jgi:hypothetical protein
MFGAWADDGDRPTARIRIVSTRHPVAILVLLLIVGALLGSILNEVLSPILPVLRHSAGGGLSPSTLSLPPLSVTFGFDIRLSLGTAVGLVAALIAYRRF